MLTETAVSAILEASITGAGLILAIYALITPISRRLFKEKVELRRKKKEEFDKIKKKISSSSSLNDFKRLETLASEIKKTRAFPRYLGVGVLTVFLGFGITAIVCAFWLLIVETFSYEIMIIPFFMFSVVAFFMVGGYAMGDVFLTMRKEFERAEKEFEEIEKQEKEVEQVKKEYEAKVRVQIEIRTYRRRKDGDTWHRCTNCTQYPINSDDVIVTKAGKERPSYGELCNECLAKEKAGDCK